MVPCFCYICVALEASAFVEKAGAFCFAHALEETVNRGLRPCNGGNVFIETGAICPKNERDEWLKRKSGGNRSSASYVG